MTYIQSRSGFMSFLHEHIQSTRTKAAGVHYSAVCLVDTKSPSTRYVIKCAFDELEAGLQHIQHASCPRNGESYTGQRSPCCKVVVRNAEAAERAPNDMFVQPSGLFFLTELSSTAKAGGVSGLSQVPLILGIINSVKYST